MENLQITPVLGKIEFDFTGTRELLEEKMSVYQGLIVEEDNIPQTKKDLADIRKLRTSLEDQRKAVKSAWNEPYEAFEKEYKKLLEVVDKSIASIDKQLKDFDLKRVEEKRKHIREIYESEIEDLGGYLPLEKIYDPKWELKSCKDQDIRFAISEKKLRVRTDVEAIKALHSEIEEECLRTYRFYGNDLSKAITRNSQYVEDKERMKKRAEEEVKRKAEEEIRAKAEAEIKAQIEAEKQDDPFETDEPLPFTEPHDIPFEPEEPKKVHFIVSDKDAKEVRNFLDLTEIKFEEVTE